MASNVQTNERSGSTASKDKGAADKGFLYKELNGSGSVSRNGVMDDTTDASGN